MDTKIQQWGNSLAVRLPKSLTEKKALHSGSHVTVTETKQGILIQHSPTTKQSLKDMLRKINPNNIHDETDWGDKRGKEVW